MGISREGLGRITPVSIEPHPCLAFELGITDTQEAALVWAAQNLPSEEIAEEAQPEAEAVKVK